MRFNFHVIETLPRLAWCAHITKGNPVVNVYGGPWVETDGDWFCEGAWNGDFSEGNLPDATAFMGSGGKITNEGVLFASPSHTLERLHIIRFDGNILVSNSLAFLLVRAGDWINHNYMFYQSELTSCKEGLKKLKTWIPTHQGNKVYLYYYCNVLIDLNYAVKKVAKPSHKSFVDYADYRRFLQDEILALHQNATNSTRKVSYCPLTTISTGYDSPVCAVLAMGIGCDESVTFTNARPTFKDNNDSGRKIGELMGLRVIEYDREAYLHEDNFPEAEFLACGTGGVDVIMAPLSDLLPGKILFTGFHGDKVWDINNKKISSDIIRGDASGTSLAEFRLRLGFIHLPVPFLGIVQHPSIHVISKSHEMQPWSNATYYNRPIPRRIIEEFGIPGNLFGQQKKAITQQFPDQLLDLVMSKNSYHDFIAFSKSSPRFRWGRRVLFKFMGGLYYLNRMASIILHRICKSLNINYSMKTIIPDKFGKSKRNPLIFNWGIDKIKGRYMIPNTPKKIALDNSNPL
ncbi:MAG TPA: hypothetical protein VGA95_04050 [Thermodesulfobacteriota bacterium]